MSKPISRPDGSTYTPNPDRFPVVRLPSGKVVRGNPDNFPTSITLPDGSTYTPKTESKS